MKEMTAGLNSKSQEAQGRTTHEGLSRARKQESKGRKNKQQKVRWHSIKGKMGKGSGAPRGEKGNSGAELIFRSVGRSRKR